jgi:hypothetical protein
LIKKNPYFDQFLPDLLISTFTGSILLFSQFKDVAMLSLVYELISTEVIFSLVWFIFGGGAAVPQFFDDLSALTSFGSSTRGNYYST